MADHSWVWCPDCKCWVPAESMYYFDGTRACKWCVEGTTPPQKFVHEPHHGQVRCIYCDSWSTTELVPDWNRYKCNDCGETFRRL